MGGNQVGDDQLVIKVSLARTARWTPITFHHAQSSRESSKASLQSALHPSMWADRAVFGQPAFPPLVLQRYMLQRDTTADWQ